MGIDTEIAKITEIKTVFQHVCVQNADTSCGTQFLGLDHVAIQPQGYVDQYMI